MSHLKKNVKLPWQPGTTPLMLAPMQGLTNRALRSLFCERFEPDLVFTEFIRIRPGSGKKLTPADRLEATDRHHAIPLVVQLIGRDIAPLVAAAQTVQDLGARHINLNLGCPYGRMTGNSAGGALLKEPDKLAEMLAGLRSQIRGSFSLKLRAGFEEPDEVLALADLFEESGVDFLILHPRTVTQRYTGRADHAITTRLVKATRLPVIANGDIFTAAEGRRLLAETGAVGLMLGRGAISDPFLFKRLRGSHPENSTPETRLRELKDYLAELLSRYREIFCGEQQALNKLKEVLALIREPGFVQTVKQLRKCRHLDRFSELLA